MPSDITTALAAVTSTAAAHAQALRDLGGAASCDMSADVERVMTNARSNVSSVSRMVAEAQRPKGPTVRIIVENRYSSKNSEVTAELVRTTSTQAMLRYKGRSNEEAYKIERGYRVRRGSSFDDLWRIHPDDLPMVHNFKAGHNAVSKALDAIAKGTPDAV